MKITKKKAKLRKLRVGTITKKFIFQAQCSRDAGRQIKGRGFYSYLSFLPYDKPDCVCIDEVRGLHNKMAEMNSQDRERFQAKFKNKWNCPRTKKMDLYHIICRNCGDKVGEVHSVDNKLTDWCNFHYYNWHNKTHWHGCLTPNISRIDGLLTFECACGADTRDFRSNLTYTPQEVEAIEKVNSKHRKYGLSKSMYRLQKSYKGR